MSLVENEPRNFREFFRFLSHNNISTKRRRVSFCHFTASLECGIIDVEKETHKAMKFQKYYGIPKDAEYGEEFMSRFPILF